MSGREALPKVREWSGVPPGGTGVVGRTSGMSESGREALPEVREALPEDQVWSEGPKKVRELSRVSPR